ncbi:CxxC-x17-CxxC domain-containing protein [Patescibacteria group bacterium]
MKDYNRRGGGRGEKRFGGDDRRMHKTTCSNCSKDCKVPFKPTGEKPVYCSDCFEEKGGGENRKSFNKNNRSPRKSDHNLQKKFDGIYEKLDKIYGEVLSIKKTLSKEFDNPEK